MSRVKRCIDLTEPDTKYTPAARRQRLGIFLNGAEMSVDDHMVDHYLDTTGNFSVLDMTGLSLRWEILGTNYDSTAAGADPRTNAILNKFRENHSHRIHFNPLGVATITRTLYSGGPQEEIDMTMGAQVRFMLAMDHIGTLPEAQIIIDSLWEIICDFLFATSSRLIMVI